VTIRSNIAEDSPSSSDFRLIVLDALNVELRLSVEFPFLFHYINNKTNATVLSEPFRAAYCTHTCNSYVVPIIMSAACYFERRRGLKCFKDMVVGRIFGP
jgi:hypothetical protein